MTEKQKMLAGELYLAADLELKNARIQSTGLAHLYNQTLATAPIQRQEILERWLGNIGSDIEIEPPFYCDYGTNIAVGNKFYANCGCIILDCNLVNIGDNVLFGPYVQVYTAYHPVDPVVRLTGREFAAPVTIGNNVWIGGGAIVCPGVSIGDNTTIGAGSVVVKNIPSNSLAVGNPCQVIRAV
ncbi:sugar O-acetyltransferase [Chamaesiphon sp.]|uniref:sugar O-acetyltransferase n=1 Tax=Chamaesiphon sp. TaxID=2814140 RepID=UPI00359428B0